MAERFVATFDSERPWMGVVVDEESSRYAAFPSVAHAERVAEKMNAQELDLGLPQLAPLLTWRSTVTGDVVHNPPVSGSSDE